MDALTNEIIQKFEVIDNFVRGIEDDQKFSGIISENENLYIWNADVFQNLKECLIEQIIKLNIAFWFQTYHSLIAVPSLQSIPNATIKVEDDAEKEKLKEAPPIFKYEFGCKF